MLLPDVSEFQSGASAPNWAGIKTQNGGAGIIRVCYGTSHLDKMFVTNKNALQSNGFQFALLYQYLRADQDAGSQAVAFCNYIGAGNLKPWMKPCLDLEEGSGDQTGRAATWFSYVDHFFGLDNQALPQRSWLYTGQAFGAGASNLDTICNSARHTWVAAYQSSPPSLPHTLWQSTDGSSGSHITSWPGCGKVDTNYTGLTLSQLVASIASTTEDDDVPLAAVAHWVDGSGNTYRYHARIDPSSNDLQYMGPDTSYAWVNITGSNASSGVSMSVSDTGEKVICYTNLAGHTCQYVAAPGATTWTWQDLDS
jgi:hypothetical protein